MIVTLTEKEIYKKKKKRERSVSGERSITYFVLEHRRFNILFQSLAMYLSNQYFLSGNIVILY